MSIFTKILEKLGLKKPAPEAAKRPETGGISAKRTPAPGVRAAPGARTASRTESIPVVDVVAQLEEKAAKNPQELNWKVSIVDLLKLLGIDSSLEARKELARELGVPADYMNDSVKMNTWLHKTVLKKIAENGGNIPQNLLD